MVLLPRTAALRLRELLSRFPAVALLGPCQSGKTTLAQALADELGDDAVYLDLELPSDRAKFSDPELYLSEHENQLVILDEIQRAPGIFQVLRSLIDRRRRKDIRARQFLLLGSASIGLLKQSAESLAGRIAYLELTPFTAPEVAASGAVHSTGYGCAADSQTVFWRPLIRRAMNGVWLLSKLIWSAIFPLWGLAYHPRRCTAFGRCSPTITASY